jgi:hypothetical protein
LTGSVSEAPFEYEYHFIEYEYEYDQEQPFLVTKKPGKQRKVVTVIVGDRSLVGFEFSMSTRGNFHGQVFQRASPSASHWAS